MREIKFRAWLERGKCYVTPGGFIHLVFANLPFLDDGYLYEQFTGLFDKNGKEIYEGDIVRVLTDRMPTYGNQYQPTSQFDKRKVESRSVIVFERYEWRLNTKNAFNSEIVKLRGKETDERHLTLHSSLADYDFFQNSEFNREKNGHAYWNDIEVIGNIHENPELLDKAV